MGDARSKLDILYQEVLGEIHEVINRVEKLDANIATTIDQAGRRIELQAANLLVVSEQLRERLEPVAAAAVMKAVEAGKADLREATSRAASEAMRNAVGAEVGRIEDAVGQLASTAQALRSRRLEAAAMALAAGMASALLVVGIFYATGIAAPKPMELSDADAAALSAGRALARALPKLSPQERERITKMVESNH